MNDLQSELELAHAAVDAANQALTLGAPVDLSTYYDGLFQRWKADETALPFALDVVLFVQHVDEHLNRKAKVDLDFLRHESRLVEEMLVDMEQKAV